MVQQLHQMVLQESVLVHEQLVRVLVAPELQRAAPVLQRLAEQLALQQVVLESLQQVVLESLQQVVLESLQLVRQLVEKQPLLSVQTLE
jgi:hypothetical protein